MVEIKNIVDEIFKIHLLGFKVNLTDHRTKREENRTYKRKFNKAQTPNPRSPTSD